MTATVIRTYVRNKQETYSGIEVYSSNPKTQDGFNYSTTAALLIQARKHIRIFDTATCVIFDWHFCKQSNLRSFLKALIGWEKADPSKRPLLFWSCKQAIYRETESFLSHHQTSKHQSPRLGSVPNLNSQASSLFSEGWKPPSNFIYSLFTWSKQKWLF